MIYEYRCKNELCRHEFEVEQSIMNEPIKFCPKCEAEVQRLISSNINFLLKGTGWYIDGYSSSGEKK